MKSAFSRVGEEKSPRGLVCVSACPRGFSELQEFPACWQGIADLLELRLDCLAPSELNELLTSISVHLSGLPVPLIITFRPREQGGCRDLTISQRAEFWGQMSQWAGAISARQRALYIFDLELDLLESCREFGTSFPADTQVIASYHNPLELPRDLDQIYNRLAASGSAVIKVAIEAGDITDCLPIFSLLDRAQRDRREIIAIAMGPCGVLTRILGPSRGSRMTYASPDQRPATASGQPTVSALRELYRLKEITAETQVMGITGFPLEHSLSPLMHNAAFASLGLDAVYIPFPAKRVDQFVKRMAHPRTREMQWNLQGFSVTSPHKESIIASLDHLDNCAEEIGAVNTVVTAGNDFIGYNTDAEAALAPLLKCTELAGARVAVIGAGGAARALVWGLKREGAEVMVCARRTDRAALLASYFNVDHSLLQGGCLTGFNIVINATPLGTKGPLEAECAVEAEHLKGVSVAYDLVYAPEETLFIRNARQAGCAVLSGTEMLVGQAAAQFKLWTGLEAPLEVMRSAMLKISSGEKDSVRVVQ